MKTALGKILVILLTLSLVAGALTISDRWNLEKNHNQVEMYLDFFEVYELAKQSDYDVAWWLLFFRELGITHVVLEEESIGLMQQALKPLRVEVGRNLLKEWNWQQFVPPALVRHHEAQGINYFDLIIMTEDSEIYGQISTGLMSRYDPQRFTLYPETDGYVVIIHGSIEDAVYSPPADLTDFEGRNFFREVRLHSSQLTRLGLGFDKKKINLIQQAGLNIMPRPFSYADWGGEMYLRGFLADLEKYNMIPGVLFFAGRQLPGYADDSLDKLIHFMKQHDVKAGLIESSYQRGHLEQDGLEELVEALEYNAVRVFNVWPFVQERYRYYRYEGAEEIKNTLFRGVTERNIRVIYFKPFKETSTVYVTDPAEYKRIFQRFEQRIARHGLSLGEASVFPAHSPNLMAQLIMSFGIVAAGVLLLKILLPLPQKFLYLVLIGGAILVTSLFMVNQSWGEKFTALTAAILFPSLSMWLFCSHAHRWMSLEKPMSYREALKQGILLLMKMSLVTGMGALLVAAMLSDVRYLLEMDIFRGVKVGQLIPIPVYGLIFLHFFGYRRKDEVINNPGIRPTEVVRLLLEDIKILYAAALGFLLAAGYVYIVRTGHEGGLQPSEIEMILRNVLEETLLARPRTKEFIIAFPALILGAYLASLRFKSLIFVSGLAAIIGQTSIVNTFSHLRTPVNVSVIRTIYSMIAGSILAAVYLGVLVLIVGAFKKWGLKIWRVMEKES